MAVLDDRAWATDADQQRIAWMRLVTQVTAVVAKKLLDAQALSVRIAQPFTYAERRNRGVRSRTRLADR
jgi:hypothetical protein